MNGDFLETIRVTDGIFHLLPLHIERMEATCREAYLTDAPKLNLSNNNIPEKFRKGNLKCRVRYSRIIEAVEFEPYTPRSVKSLKMVSDDNIDYHLKYSDRTRLNEIRSHRGDADEVIIVRDGLVTDTSYSNLLFRAGNRFLTPAHPLLNGVMRRWLLRQGFAIECDITPEMLRPNNDAGISEVMLINAMLPPGSISPIPIDHIIF